jgi:hypothetical protein
MMVNDDFREKLQKCPTDDCCPIQQVVWEAILGEYKIGTC